MVEQGDNSEISNSETSLMEIDTSSMESAWLTAIVDSANDAIISKTLQGIIISWNKGAERIFGYTSDEAIGQPILMLIPPDHIDEEPFILDRIRIGERIEHYETIRRRKDGSLLDISLTVSPIKDTTGRVIGVSKIARDISHQKAVERKLRESEARFRYMADTAPVMIWLSGEDAKFYWFNRPWLEFTGRTLNEETRNDWYGVHPDDFLRTTTIYNTSFAARTPFKIEYRLRRHDGKYRWVLDHGIPRFSENSTFLGFIGSCVDISDFKQMEAALKDADRRKDEFLATLAHELRNPLAPIRSGLEIIRQSSAVQTPEIKETIDIIERQTNQIVHLVDDLLDISRITQGKIKLKKERIEIRTAIELALESCRDIIESNNHKFTLSLPEEAIYLDADLTRIAQIILNVLNNAAKYTPPNGNISLSVRKKSGKAEISIRDSGIGIPHEMLLRIFDIFSQLEETSEQARSGLGIGLSVVKKLVELHGGTIHPFSEGEGKGSEFIIKLPLAENQTDPISEMPQETLDDITETAYLKTPLNGNSPAAAAAKKQILIVDDNADAAEMLRVLLTLEGHQVRTVYDGETAIQLIPEFQPEICLCDIGLPKMDGYELARNLKTLLPEALLISISGWGQDEDRARSKQAGFKFHMVKPVEFEELLNLISHQN